MKTKCNFAVVLFMVIFTSIEVRSQSHMVVIDKQQFAYLGIRNRIKTCCLAENDSLYSSTGSILYENNIPKYWIPNFDDHLVIKHFDGTTFTEDTFYFQLRNVNLEGVSLIGNNHNYTPLEQFEGIRFFSSQDLSFTEATEDIQILGYDLIFVSNGIRLDSLSSFDYDLFTTFLDDVKLRDKKDYSVLLIENITVYCKTCLWPSKTIFFKETIQLE